MDSKQIILIVVTIKIIFGKADAVKEPPCMEQLQKVGKFIGDETSTDAFTHVFFELAVGDKTIYPNARGQLYQYIDHLYSAAVALIGYIYVEDPVVWCTTHINEYFVIYSEDITSVCKGDMEKAKYIGTVQDNLYEAFYNKKYYEKWSGVANGYFNHLHVAFASNIIHTNAKGPKDFCDNVESKIPQTPVKVIEKCVFDPTQTNLQPAAQQNVHFNLYPSQAQHQPPANQNEHFVFSSISHSVQPQVHQYEHLPFDLNLQPVESIPLDLYHSLYHNQPDTSKSYEDDDKNVGFDLNALPPNE